MALPTPYLLRYRDYGSLGEDAHGNAIEGYGEPVDWPVHGIAPGASQEPGKPNRDLSFILWTVFAPAGDSPDERGQVSFPWEDKGGEFRWYDVDGPPADWSRGPWPSDLGGIVVELRRVEG